MIVDLPEPDDPTRAVTVPGLRHEADAVQHGLVGLVGKLHILEAHRALDRRHLQLALPDPGSLPVPT